MFPYPLQRSVLQARPRRSRMAVSISDTAGLRRESRTRVLAVKPFDFQFTGRGQDMSVVIALIALRGCGAWIATSTATP